MYYFIPGNNFVTTAMDDFIKPETMTGDSMLISVTVFVIHDNGLYRFDYVPVFTVFFKHINFKVQSQILFTIGYPVARLSCSNLFLFSQQFIFSINVLSEN